MDFRRVFIQQMLKTIYIYQNQMLIKIISSQKRIICDDKISVPNQDFYQQSFYNIILPGTGTWGVVNFHYLLVVFLQSHFESILEVEIWK